DVEDVDFQFLVDVDDLVRVGDPPPAHVGDVQEAVDAAEVHEGAEVGDVLDHALADLADLDLLQQIVLHLLAQVLDQLAAADDDVAPGLVDLQDLALDGPADVVADVRRPADVHLAGRQEDVDADVDQQAALDLAGDHAADDVALLVLGEDRLPLLLPFGLAVGEVDDAVLVLDGLEQHLDRLANLGRDDLVAALLAPLLKFDDAFRLVADLDEHVFAADVEDAAVDDLVDFVLLLLFGEPGFVEQGVDFGVEVGRVELAQEVTVDHEGLRFPIPGGRAGGR